MWFPPSSRHGGLTAKSFKAASSKIQAMISLEGFKALALSYNDVTEAPHFEKTSFRVKKKIFATLDGKNKRAMLILPEIEQSVFCAYNQEIIYPVNGTWGKQGATYFELSKVPLPMLRDALKVAYEYVLLRLKKK
jgi:hypothetical protein